MMNFKMNLQHNSAATMADVLSSCHDVNTQLSATEHQTATCSSFITQRSQDSLRLTSFVHLFSNTWLIITSLMDVERARVC